MRFGPCLLALVLFSTLSIADAAPPEHAPVAQHTLLAKLAGDWLQHIQVFPAPGAPPIAADGTVHGEMILGGRFLKLDLKSVNSGMMILGFDTRHNRYTYYSIGDNGTFAVTAEGDYDPLRRQLTLRGFDEEAGGLTPFRFCIQFEDDGSYSYDLFFTRDGHEAKFLHTTHRRR
jgi:hypothetical protein